MLTLEDSVRARLTPEESRHLADVASSLRQILVHLDSMTQADAVGLLRHLYTGIVCGLANVQINRLDVE